MAAHGLIGSGDKWRTFGPFINPDFFAGYLVITLPVTLGAYLVARRTVLATLLGLAFAVETMALMLTGSKAGILSALIALVVFFVAAVGTRSLRRSRFTRLIVIAVILLPLLVIFINPVKSRIVAAESGGSQTHSTAFRVYTWRGTVEIIKANPWTGVGPGAFSVAYPRYTLAGPTSYAHQSYLQTAAESGIIAAVAFLLILLAVAGKSALGIVSGPVESPNRAHKSTESASSASQAMAWSDLVPFSGWRIINCAIFASLIGSIIRNGVDSDWYVIGIALPFWTLAGVLAAQSGAARARMALKPVWQKAAVVVCGLGILMSISFGLGDWFASGDPQSSSMAQVRHGYTLASAVSPLNPRYHRELAKYLIADGEADAAARQADAAIRLSPTDASNYYVRGMVDLSADEPEEAIRYFKRSLKWNPNSTRTLYSMALTYQSMGDIPKFEATLKSIIAIEDTDYEQIKGAPEMVDTTYARAHVYFANKYLAQKKYAAAADEYRAAIDRLEDWRSHEQYVNVAIFAGMLTKEEERDLLELLRDSYQGLSQAYSAMGNKSEAAEAMKKGENVKTERE